MVAVMAVAVERYIRCPRCGHHLAMWMNDSHDWQPLGARIKRFGVDDRGSKTSFVCPLCGAWKKIPNAPSAERREA